ITYGPRFRGWGWRSSVTSHRLADGSWEEWAGAKNKDTYQFTDNRPPLPRTRDGKRINTVLALPVADTNTQWRIVLNVEESPPWPPWPIMMADRIKAFVRRTPLPQPLGLA